MSEIINKANDDKSGALVFTDLDGTLLDHDTYSYEQSLEGINILKSLNIDLILVSSKTFCEMEVLSSELGFYYSFIFENGAGYANYSPEQGFVKNIFGMTSDELHKKIPIIADILQSDIVTFNDMSVEEVCELTSLDYDKAVNAKKRDASMPFIVKGDTNLSQKEIFKINDLISKEGVSITKGGRFYHLLSSGVSKGEAINYMINNLFNAGNYYTMGIGDSLNDLSMLEVVDVPFLVNRHTGYCVNPRSNNLDIDINFTENIGPAGFTEAVKKFVKMIESD